MRKMNIEHFSAKLQATGLTEERIAESDQLLHVPVGFTK